MRHFKALIAAMLFFSSGFSGEVDVLKNWKVRIDAAQEVAKEKGCPMLIAFLGPNWCPFSDKLEEEVLFSEPFVKEVGNDLVLVKIDIPEDFEEATFYGKEWKKLYGIEECPTIVIAESNGRAIAKLDFLPIKCHDFTRYIHQTLSDYQRVSHLEKKELKQMKIDELKHLYARAGKLADTTFKNVLMDQGLKVDRGPYFLVEQYGSLLASGSQNQRKLKRIRNKILARDPKNVQGCQRKLALIDFETPAAARGPFEVIEPLVKYLKKFGHEDADNAWRLEMKISQYLFSKDQIEESLKHARLSYEMAPLEEQNEIAQSIEYLKTFHKNG